MRATLMLTGMAVAGAALVAVALLTVLTDGPRDPASASTDGPGDTAVLTASVAHASGVDDAVRELDLIRPPRPKQASDFTVSLLGGETLKLRGQRGKPVLVNFWATWCAPCREEMPAMERLYLKHRERGFVLLAVSVDTDASLVKPFLERLKLTFPVALDAKMDLANAYGVRALPASFLIDRNGYLTALALGPRAWDHRAAHALVEGMLAQ
ncbi:MAG: thiol-disulfide oxidoreductase [Candidatus Rokuibacteriota bacterium]|nr:MAG: thiol-disulfide oxidoreductase [Candidatus Rokubacteria bacterium]